MVPNNKSDRDLETNSPVSGSRRERPKVILAAHVFILRQEKVLALRRANTHYMNGRYGVPGGHVEPGESASQAAIRETLEECGIRIANEDLVFSGVMHRFAIGEPLARIEIFYTCHAWKGLPLIAEPHKFDDLTWIPADVAPPNMVPYVAAALEALRSYPNGAWYREVGWELRSEISVPTHGKR